MIYDIKYRVSQNPAKVMDNRTQQNYKQVDKYILLAKQIRKASRPIKKIVIKRSHVHNVTTIRLKRQQQLTHVKVNNNRVTRHNIK